MNCLVSCQYEREPSKSRRDSHTIQPRTRDTTYVKYVTDNVALEEGGYRMYIYVPTSIPSQVLPREMPGRWKTSTIPVILLPLVRKPVSCDRLPPY